MAPMSTDEPQDGAPWFQTAFEAPYLTLYRHRTDEAARKEVAWAAVHLRRLLGGGSDDLRLLDLGCGNGRHARALADHGFVITGLDYSQDLLVAAEAKDASRPIRYLRGDMRDLPLDGPFDAVTSFFTSFGYFADEADDRRVLAEVARVLSPTGVYLLDFLQAEQVRRSLVPESVEERDGWRLEQQRRITPDGRRVEKTVHMTASDGSTRRYTESVRLYELADFRPMLDDVGMTVSEVYGSLAGDDFAPDSPRLVLLCRPS